MSELARESCVACRADSPLVTEAERGELAPRIPEWRSAVEEGVEKLRRTFRFPDFAQALAFTVRVGEMADREGHHPTLVTEWGRVTVLWWTHKIHGLHRNDFVAAAKTDELFQG